VKRWSFMLAATATLYPLAAWACPACATRSSGPGTLALVGAMIAIPYGVAAVALKVIRRLDRPDEES
jgi:hypothetical protein